MSIPKPASIGEDWSAKVDFSKQPDLWTIVYMSKEKVYLERGNEVMQIENPEFCKEFCEAGYSEGDQVELTFTQK